MSTTSMMRRTLGGSGIEVSPIGLGCWAIGGPFTLNGRADNYGPVDDQESLRAIRRAFELGVTFFDTADAYGRGHSEMLLGRALGPVRDQVVIATKAGYVSGKWNPALIRTDASPYYLRQALHASLSRLGTDVIDLYQLHLGSLPAGRLDEVFGTFEAFRTEGLIRAYGWSTDERAGLAAASSRWPLASVQHELNVLTDQPGLLAEASTHGLATIANMPLAMGLLSGKFRSDSRLGSDDVRGSGHEWVRYFRDGRPRPDLLAGLAAIREILTSDGRTLAQGALSWVIGRGENTIAIPGFRTLAQVEENAATLGFGPLDDAAHAEIATLLAPFRGE